MSKPLRVLIVEDSEDDATLVLREMRRGGYEPDYARVETASAMRTALLKNKWEIVISDYSMPRFNALAALEVLDETGLDLPCIIVSGTIGEETAVQIMKAGASDYIMKDNLKRLIPAIERELREAGVRRERRRAEEALRESEERYRSLVDNIDIGVTLVDSQYTVIMTNAAQTSLFSRLPDRLVGTKCYESFAQIHSICAHCPAVQAMSQSEPAEAEIECNRGDGARSNLRIRAFPTFDKDGVVSGCIEVVEDVTERTRLEAQLRQAARLESIGRLAGGVAHDFNNLLTAMIGYSDMLLQQMYRDNPYRDKVVQINRAAERAAELTRQLLAFSRKQVLSVKVLDLNSLITDFEKILCRLLGADVELRAVLEKNLDPVVADPGQMEQILLNLAVNARDAMPSGGRLTMETANVTLDEEHCRTHPDVTPGRYVMFAVSDTGTGMDSIVRSNIFDPFFTTKELGKGTGLGLSTVYGIVKQHRGHIFVDSEPGRGATFKVFLPCASRAPEPHMEAVASKLQHRGTETIVIVEDEEVVRNLMSELLKLLGYFVFPTSHPGEAIQFVARHVGPVHLLLTDIVLPQMDGPRLFKNLSPDRPEMKVLYVSGYTQNSIVNNGVLKPGVNFLQKPFTLDKLAAKVREVLDE